MMDADMNQNSKSFLVNFNIKNKEFANLKLTLEESKIIKKVSKKPGMKIPRDAYFGVFALCVLLIFRFQKQ